MSTRLPCDQLAGLGMADPLDGLVLLGRPQILLDIGTVVDDAGLELQASPVSLGFQSSSIQALSPCLWP